MIKVFIALFVIYALAGAATMLIAYIGYTFADTIEARKSRDAIDELAKMGGDVTGIGKDRYFKRLLFEMGLLWPKVWLYKPDHSDNKVEDVREMYKEYKAKEEQKNDTE